MGDLAVLMTGTPEWLSPCEGEKEGPAGREQQRHRLHLGVLSSCSRRRHRGD